MILLVLFIVFWVLGILIYPWPGSPAAGWPWAPHLLYMVLFALLGLAVFGIRI